MHSRSQVGSRPSQNPTLTSDLIPFTPYDLLYLFTSNTSRTYCYCCYNYQPLSSILHLFNTISNGQIEITHSCQVPGNVRRASLRKYLPFYSQFNWYATISPLFQFISSFAIPTNLIPLGYARVVLAGASLYYMSYHPHYCTILYSISCLLDALDGYAARKYNQSTKFGAVLDMVTDRCTTSCLLCFLSSAYPKWAILFQSLISLDLASHYMHM